MSFEVSRLTKIEARGKKLQKCMSATSGFWSDFKNLTKSKNKGHFIIATSKVTIIKWSYFCTNVTPRPGNAKEGIFFYVVNHHVLQKSSYCKMM